MGILKKKTTTISNRRQSSNSSVRLVNNQQRQNPFQRNRTLVGSTSSQVKAVHNISDLPSSRKHAHRLSLKRRKIGVVLLIVFGAISVSFWLLTQLTASVIVSLSNVTINQSVDTSTYQKAVNDYLNINPISRLRFAVDWSGLNSYLLQTHPEIAKVSQISLVGLGETKFTLEMREPVAGWKIKDKQYFVDAKGVAFEKNYYDNPKVQIIDDSGAELQQGTTVASNRFLGFVGRVVALSKNYKYTVVQAILPAGTTRQLEVRIENIAPLVKLSIDRPAGDQVEDMNRAISYLSSRGQNPEYIDVRVSGKAFYK